MANKTKKDPVLTEAKHWLMVRRVSLEKIKWLEEQLAKLSKEYSLDVDLDKDTVCYKV